MKTIITAFILLGLTSCSEHKLDWQGDNPKPDTLVVDIKAMPLESDTVTY